MKFKEVCKKLGIKKYAKRIWNSNSHGELFFIYDYYNILRICEKDKSFSELFPYYMDAIVSYAEENWERPESVFQHIPKMLKILFEE